MWVTSWQRAAVVSNEEAGLETLSKYADLYGLTDKSGVEIGEYAPDVSTKDPGAFRHRSGK